jgi:PKD repeat protein
MNERRTTTGTTARTPGGGPAASRASRLLAASLVATLTATLLVAVSFVAAPAASAAPGDIGTPGASLAGFATPTPTAPKPESKLWFAFGSWWASMASTATGGYRIHRLDRAAGTWVDTGVDLDPRGATQADVLWNGTHLFVASHAVAASSTTTSALEPARLFRYSWDGSTWTPDAGFPITITGTSVEALTIAQNALGRVWATWTLNKRVYLAQTTASADAASVLFGTSFIPLMNNLTSTDSATATSLTSDDISTIVSADGVTTLVWSNQVTGQTWSARRVDSTSTWTANPIVSGTLMSDDHLNLRAIPGDPAQRVVAVLKTSRNDASPSVPTDPLLVAAVYTPASGTWTTTPFATVADSGTRPMAVLDPANDQLHVFYTGPSTAGIVAFTGTVYEKSSSLSAPSFAGPGTPVLREASNATMNNATSAKLPATAGSGVLVLAATETSPRYWFADFGGIAPPTASFSTSTTSGTAPLPVSFSDTSTGGATSWAWDFGDGGTSTSRNTSHTFTDSGAYTVTLTATNDGGSTTASTVVQVGAPVAPTTSFTSSATSGTAPLPVSFTDTSTGAPTSWAWDFGDGGTSTSRNPSHTFTAPGSYTVTLTTTNAGGSTSATTTVDVVAPVAPTASFTSSTMSGTAPLPVSFTDTSTGGATSWAWDFGDGGTSTSRNPSHTFTAVGSYPVTLTATNAGGSTSASTTVVVSLPAAPSASFTASATSGSAPLAVTFTNTSTGGATSWAWDFGDGGTSTVQSPSHTFTAAGTYTVTLTATNAGGSTSASTVVVVSPAPALTPLDRVNVGGAALAGGWLVDTATSRSPWSNAASTKTGVATTTSAINVSDPSIPAGTPAALFQSSRYDLSGGKNMIWTMPVNGLKTYTVRLYFAETFFTAPGKRVFDVSINGTKVLTGFDIVAAAGGAKRGVVRTFTVTTGSPIVITFGRKTDNPQVNAIEVLS